MSAHAGLYGPEAVTDAAGRPQRLINVVVTQPDGTTPAVLYTDRTKTVILSTNAVQTDSDGDLSFYADPGQYVIRWTTAGVTHQKTVEVGVDFADQGGGVAAVSSVNGHTGDVVLVAADVGADAAGAAAAAVTTHVAASDPHGDRAHADAAVATEQTRAQTVEAAKADLVGGLVPIAQIPPAAFDLVQAVATVTDMLALSVGGKGALVRVADDGSGSPALFLLPAGADPTNEANWVEVSMDAEGAAAAALAAAETFATAAAALRVAKAGDTMTGPLVLPGAPTTGLQAATKDYVDAETTRATGAETANATAISAETTRATGVEAGKVAKTGDTMSGDLAMAGHRVTGLADPALAQDAATRAYVLAQIAALVNSAPAILDTLGEIATQLASDESTATALATTVAGKLAIAQNLADLANAGTARTNLGLGSVATHAASEFAPALTRTAVKTGAYTAAAGDLVPVDTATPNANVTVTLPNAPAVGSRVTVKHIAVGAGKSVTIACAGTDVFNKTGGPTSATLTLLNQAIGVQYDTGGIWTVVADDIPKSALDGAYATRRLQTVAIFGDSYTYNCGAYPGQGGTQPFFSNAIGYWSWAQLWLRHGLKLLGNFGVAGQTTTQMLARVTDVTAISPAPGWVVIASCGINDINGGATAAAIMANLAAMVVAMRAVGSQVVLTILPPRNSLTTAQRQVQSDLNKMIRDYAHTTPGVYVCDWRAKITEPTTDAWRAGYGIAGGDGVHPGEWGAAAMGYDMAQLMTPMVPVNDQLPTTNIDPNNSVTNAFMTGSGGTAGTGVTGTVPAGWLVQGTSGAAVSAVCSLVTPTDNQPGNWLQVALASGDGTIRWQDTTAVPGAFAVGDYVSGIIECQRDADWTGIVRCYGQLTFRDAANTTNILQSLDLNNSEAPGVLLPTPYMPTTWIFKTPPVQVPVNTGRRFLDVRFQGGSGTIRVRRAAIFKADYSPTPPA